MSESASPAMDIRLMNAASAVLFSVFALLLLVSATRWVARLAAFDIQGITVRGDMAHNNIPSMRANVLPRVRGTFFTTELLPVRQAYESMPWVRQAVVRRDFPNRLRNCKNTRPWPIGERKATRACSTALVKCLTPTSTRSSPIPFPVWPGPPVRDRWSGTCTRPC